MISFLGDGALAYLCHQEILARGLNVSFTLPDRTTHDLLVSVQHAHKIKSDELRKFRLCVNLHTGLLPQNRGVHTSAAPILRGDLESGVTLHEMTDVIDGGDVILKAAYPLLPTDTCESLYYKTRCAGVALFRQFLDSLGPFENGRVAPGQIAKLLVSKVPQPPGGNRTLKNSIDFGEALDEADPLFERKLRAYFFPQRQCPIVIREGRRFRVTSLLPTRYEAIGE